MRTKRSGTHELRLAFPPGPRRKGAGKLIEILHPKKENPGCSFSEKVKNNPELLLIFGNPTLPAASRARVKRLLESYHTMRRGGMDREAAERQALTGALLNEEEKKVFQRAVRRRNPGTQNHKPGCGCFACKHARGEKNSTKTARARPARRRRTTNAGDVQETKKAVRVFETFHGRSPQEILELQRKEAARSTYAALGDLIAVGLDNPNRLDGDALANRWEKECAYLGFRGDGVKLASATTGRQLYLIGGKQDLDSVLSGWEGVDPQKDFIDLGEAVFVVYDARKRHANFQPVEYTHQFGEEGGSLPRIVYDRLKKEIALVGGEYFIDLEQPLSPGIEN